MCVVFANKLVIVYWTIEVRQALICTKYFKKTQKSTQYMHLKHKKEKNPTKQKPLQQH